MEEKIAQLEEKLNQLELLEHQVRATFLSVSDEAKNREKYENVFERDKRGGYIW